MDRHNVRVLDATAVLADPPAHLARRVAALRGGRELFGATREQAGLVIELHPSAWSWSGDSRADLEAILVELRRRPIALSGQKDPLAEHGQVYFESWAAA